MMERVIMTMILCVTSAMAQRIRIPGESGPEVVEAVVDQVRTSCVLPQDNLLLRRLAYVESRDGTDPQTYRNGFHGGIWQVTQAMYDVTKSASDLDEARRAISDHLMIDWSSANWIDLRAPLFSGLAAALFIRHSLQGRPSPVGIPEQETYWASVYHNQSLSSHHSRYTDLVDLMQKGCHEGQPVIDLIFAVDTSSSISSEDFQASKAFIVNTTSQLDLIQEHTRVAVITFSNAAQVRISWGTHQQSQQELSEAIEALNYQRGGTETDDALDLVRQIFVGQGRASALKVVVLITDGESHDPIDTAHAAQRLSTAVAGLLVLAVGVGDQVNEDELRSIATNPPCTHVFRVDTYDQISALIEEILRITCRAPVILHPGETVSCVENICPPYMVEQSPGKKMMLKVSTSCNTSQTLYGSSSAPYPSQGSASITHSLPAGGFAVIYLPRNTNLTSTAFYNMAVAQADRATCRVTLQSLPDVIQVLCIEGGQTRNCTRTDIFNYQTDTGKQLCP